MKEKFLADYKSLPFCIQEAELEFYIYDEYVDVCSVLHVERLQEEVKNIFLDTLDLELLSIHLNTLELQEPRYELQEEKLCVYNLPSSCTLKIKNRIYPEKNSELEGLYKSGSILCTQCEPEGFRKITPFIDRPDNMAKFTTTIYANARKYPILLSNGNLKSRDFKGDMQVVTWVDPSLKPSYLFALVAGDLGFIEDSYTTKSNKEVSLAIYTDKGCENRASFAMKSLKKAMEWDEQHYNRVYDLDIYNIVAVESFNMGAMENKGLNIFNSAYVLADDEVATDKDFMGIESVISHEYFHNWTGNRITCRDWFQLTLKEGLTVFRDQSFSGDMHSKQLQRIEDVKMLKERQFVEDSSPSRHPIQPKSYISMNNFYTATVYEKGAEVIRMLYTLLGQESFFKAMEIYFDTFDGKAVTVEDFLWAMQQESPVDLSQFKRWYDQSGTPRLVVEQSFNNEKFTITCKQKIPDDTKKNKQLPLFYPLNVALFDSNGVVMQEKQLVISKEVESFVFDKVATKPKLSINRNFTAPIIVEYEQQDNLFLAMHESDGVACYEAMQSLAKRCAENYIQNKVVDEVFVEVYKKQLLSDKEPLLKSMLLEFVTLNGLISDKKNVDVELYAKSRWSVLEYLAESLYGELKTIYRQNNSFDGGRKAESIAKRALKNRALLMMSYKYCDEVFELSSQQYKSAKNMGDKLTALEVALRVNGKKASWMFKDFYEHYSTNSLLMVKYFTLLASQERGFSFEILQELERDKAFDVKVPNLVRAVYGSFGRNLAYFHAKDGSGYRFMANEIEQIDAINPQMGASLCGTFKLYPHLCKENQKLLEVEIKRLLGLNLSSNSCEILAKLVEEDCH